MGLKPHRIQVRGGDFSGSFPRKCTLLGVVSPFFSRFPPPPEKAQQSCDMFDRVLRSGHREGVATKYPPQGKPVMALIDSDSYRIEAYFEETKIPHIRAGASAEIYVMDGSPALQGAVSSIARGITDQDNIHIHLGPTGAAHSCHRPPHARATRRVGQCRNDLHRRDEGRRGTSNRARHQESHGSNFRSTFELVRCPSPARGHRDVRRRLVELEGAKAPFARGAVGAVLDDLPVAARRAVLRPSRLSSAGREPRGRCAPRTPCSRRRTGGCPRASAPAPGWTARPGSAGRARRTAWCPRTATAP